MSLQQTYDFQTKNVSLLDNSILNSQRVIWIKKQEKQQVKLQSNLKHLDEKRQSIIIKKPILNKTQLYKQNHQKLQNKKHIPITHSTHNEAIYHNKIIDQSERIQFYSLVGELKQIQEKQKQLRKSMGSFICWVTVILLLVLIFYILLLKTLFFFNTQLVGTIVESFKDQLFDPKITNDQLQLQVFYIEQGCFILTVILIFLFILTFTAIVNKYYQRKLQKYRENKKLIKHIKQRKQFLLNKIKLFNTQPTY